MVGSEATSVEMVVLAYNEEQEGQSHSSSGPSRANATPTLLYILHAPQPSDLMRPRQVKPNPPLGKKGHIRTSSNSKSISPNQRLKEFLNEALTVSAGKLFCTACREELAGKASVLKLHFKLRSIKMAKNN